MKTRPNNTSSIKGFLITIVLFLFSGMAIAQQIQGNSPVNEGSTNDYTLSGVTVTSWNVSGAASWSTISGGVRVVAGSGNFTVSANFTQAPNFTSKFVTVTPAGPARPANPTISVNNCQVTLTRTGSPPSGVTWFWQGRTNNGQITTLGSGSTYIANSGSGNYYIQARNNSGQWSTLSGSVNVSIPSTPSAPSVNNPSRSICPGQTTTFAVNSPNGSSTYRWYNSAGAWVGSGATQAVTPSSSTTYQVREVSNVGCIGSPRNLTVTLNTVPTLNVTNQSNSCFSNDIQPTAASTNETGISHVWYTSVSGNGTVTPTVISTVGQYVTGYTVNSVNQTFWVAAKVGTCEGPRKAVTATFNDNSEVPTLSVSDFSNGSNSCGIGNFDLRASGGQSGSIYRWYASATGGSQLNTGNGNSYVFSLNYANTSNGQKTYYVNGSLVNTSGCTKEITTRIPITVTVNPLPSVAGGTDTASCGTGPVILNAVLGANSDTIRWFSSPSGGGVLATGTSFTTPPLTATTSYWAESYDSNGLCAASTRKEIRAIIGTTPALTVNDAQNDCFSNDIQPTATSNNVTGISHVWYTSSTGNGTVTPTVISTVGQYVTGYTVNAVTQSFWVATKVGTCEGPRLEVIATFNDNSEVPTLSVGDFSTPNANCGSGSFELRASGGQPGSTYQWYESAIGGSAVPTDGTFVVDLDYANTTNGQKTYYVNGTLINTSGCAKEITTRIPITVTVNPIPDIASGNDSDPTCGVAPVTLNATTGSNGTIVRWYDVPTGGTPLDSGPSYTTDPISETTSFYAETFNQTTQCVAPVRVKIDAVFGAGPTITVSQNARNLCPSTDVRIQAMTTNTGTVEHFWWNDPVLNDPISTYQVEDTGGVGGFVTYLIVDGLGLTNGTGTYWVSATIDGCSTARVPVTATYVDDCGGPGGDDCIASGVSNIMFPTAGGSETFTITWNLPQCEEGVYLKTNTFEDPPTWLGVTKNPGNNFVLTVGENDSGADYSTALLLVNELGEPVGQLSFNVTQPTCSNQLWYPDNNLNDEGDQFEEPTASCAKPYGNWTLNPYNGNSTSEDLNWILTRMYDVGNILRASSKSYFDEQGKPLQTQAWNVKTDSTWANQTLYDPQGRAAISTLSAPIRQGNNFLYKAGFVKRADNTTDYDFSNYDGSKLENPDAVGNAATTLGWYYSENNNREGYQDITNLPYSKTIYSTLMPGAVLRGLGGNKVDSNNDGNTDNWAQGYTFSMRASQELSQTPAFDEIQYNSFEITKTINRDVHGVENVLFTDTDGKTLASAKSGGTTVRNMNITIEEQGYVDIHVPQGSDMGFTVNTGGATVTVYNLITESTVTAANNLPNGFYRVTINTPDAYTPGTVQISYKENYYDYSLNEYDKTSRMIASYQPLNKLKTEYYYNTLDQLLYSKSPDGGEARFKYRKDGRIRYSQNSKQRLEVNSQEFSYTNYDSYGRPIESGVLLNNNFDNTSPDADLPSGTRKEVIYTVYDALDLIDTQSLPLGYQNPRYLSGKIAKTYNDQSTSYYSYDNYGRINWIVQEIPSLGYKTINYMYDLITGQVIEVVYQKGNPDEELTHLYTYNLINQIVKVETTTFGSAPTLHAENTYYETGGLKRTELAGGLQGIDYVYNLGGQLKSINHPSLDPTQDPGGDSNDLFGMQLDYHNADYKRAVSNISTQTYGTNLFNGNIKGIRWNNEAVQGSLGEQRYAYSYDRNDWLTEADFEGNGTSGILANDSSTATFQSGDTFDLQATESYLLLPGYIAEEGSSGLVRIVESSGNISDDYDVSNISYDANGNIQSLKRNKNTISGNNNMDDLSYTYKTDKPNQLLRVDDIIGDSNNAYDIDDQNGDNYSYNIIGQLVSNSKEGIEYQYNANGLVTEVIKNNVLLVKFYYNDKNHRIKKESYADGNLQNTTYYVRDISGSVLGIYNQLVNSAITLIEQPIYSSGRIAVLYNQSNTTIYQISDHLGSIRAAFTVTEGTLETRSGTDYYPFGMTMPGRTMVGDFRYTFQGQEKDAETGKEAFELRIYDSRIGRWLSPDPNSQFDSPYLAMGNRPNMLIDPDGGCTVGIDCPTEFDWMDKGTWVLDEFIGTNTGEFSTGVPYSSGNLEHGVNFRELFGVVTPLAGTMRVLTNTSLEMSKNGIIYKAGTNNQFIHTENGKPVVYKNGFKGNQHVSASSIKNSKSVFRESFEAVTKNVKRMNYAGRMLGYASDGTSVALAVYDVTLYLDGEISVHRLAFRLSINAASTAGGKYNPLLGVGIGVIGSAMDDIIWYDGPIQKQDWRIPTNGYKIMEGFRWR